MRAGIAASAAVLAAACSDPDVIDVRVSTPTRLDPAADWSDVTVRVRDVATGQLVEEATTSPDRIGAPRDVLTADGLAVGRSYVVELEAHSLGCERGIALGRSVPFEHRDAPYQLAVQIGCAGEVAEIDPPRHARIGHRVVATADGGAIVVGGSGVLQQTMVAGATLYVPSELVSAVERYDPSQGRFVIGGDLRRPRIAPGVATLPSGDIAVAGGIVELPELVSDALDIVRPTTATVAPRDQLTMPRSAPAAIAFADRLAIIGGVATFMPPNPRPDVEIRSGDLIDDRPIILTDEEPITELAAAAVAPGVALVVAARDETPPRVALLRLDCGDGPCFEPVETEDPLPVGFRRGSLTVLGCEATRSTTTYLIGGETPSGAVAEVWCYQPGERLVYVGALPDPRSAHVAAVVHTPNGVRILAIGGDDTRALDMDVVSVDPCACAAIDPIERITLPMTAVGHDAATLADGSVLIVAGVDLFAAGMGIVRASADAALYFPESL